MSECCQELLTIIEKYNSEDPKFVKSEIEDVVSFVLSWPQRQCRCIFRDQLHLARLEDLLQRLLECAIDLICELRVPAVEDGKKSIPETDDEGERTTDVDPKGTWTQPEKERLFLAVGKIFQLPFPFYQVRKIHLLRQETTSKDCSKYCDVNDGEVPEALLVNVAFFCDKGGLSAIREAFQDADPISLTFPLAHHLINIVTQLRLWFSIQAIMQYIIPLRRPVIRYLCKLTDKDLRQPDGRLMVDSMWSAVKGPVESGPICDKDSLDLAFKYFTSSTLTVRLAGLSQIANQVHMFMDPFQTDPAAEADRQCLCKELSEWLIENKLVEHLFGPNLHVELLKQSQIILNYLARETYLTTSHLDCIWLAAQLKHASRYVHDLLTVLTKHMDMPSILYLLDLVSKLPPNAHTRQTLYLASLLTRIVWRAGLSSAVADACPAAHTTSPVRGPLTSSATSAGVTSVMQRKFGRTASLSQSSSRSGSLSDISCDGEQLDLDESPMPHPQKYTHLSSQGSVEMDTEELPHPSELRQSYHGRISLIGRMAMSSFGTYEPSDAILAAMKARVGVRTLTSGGVESSALDTDAPKSVSQGVASAPTFRLNGGLRESVPPEHKNVQAVPVVETGGIAFAVKEATRSYAPPCVEAEEGHDRSGIFQVRSSSQAKEPKEPKEPGEGLPRSQVASSSEKKLSLGHNMRRQVPALSAIEENLNADEPGRDQGERARPSSSRSAGPPCAPATSSRMSNSRSAMRDAADEALARALAQASAGLDMDLDVSQEAPHLEIPESQVLLKLPSAVTVAGEPVAAMGDMIYLGGGLYASCAPAEKAEKPVKKKPSAARKPPRRPASVMRSASAQIVGSQTSQTAESGEFGSPQSRAQSEEHVDSEHFFSDLGRGASRNGSVGGSSVGAPPGPRIWRPAGISKLPPAQLEPPAGFGGRRSRLSQEDLGRMPGDHAEERAHNRRVHGKEGLLLFGPKGVLAHMRDGEQSQVAAPPGPPQGISKRLERRKRAKEARINEILEEREMRIATEAAMSMHKRHHVAKMARHASAPELSEEELEKQRIRVACKMDILDFFHGYRKVVNKLTEEQQKVLHANLHGSGFRMEDDDAVKDASQDTESIQDRLQRVNDTCNKVFDQT